MTKDKTNESLAERLTALLEARPGESLSIKDLRTRLKVPADDRRTMRDLLAAAVARGDITALPGRRYMALQKVPMVEGVVAISRGGHGFLTGVTGQGLTEDPLIPPPLLVGLLPRERVRARLEKGRNGRLRAADIHPVDPNPVMLGTLRRGGRRFSLEVETIPEALRVAGADEGVELAEGAMVEARLQQRADGRAPGTVVVQAVLGAAGTLPVEVERLIRASGVPVDFSKAALKVAESVGADIESEARADPHRKDITHLPLVTIDGEDARDFDDAILVEPQGRNLVLTVAIADVSHYVRQGSGLDVDAAERATSVYFPGRVIPMLPERLSNDLCSLRPHLPRLCMVAQMTFGPTDVEPHHVELFPGLMKSRARLTYTRAQQGRDAGLKELPEAPGFMLDPAWALYERLRKARAERGAVDLDIPEPHVTLDRTGEPVRLEPHPRLDSHRLIEAFMIAANEAVARWFVERGIPTVYRVHEPPDEAKLSRFREVANLFARGLMLKETPKPLELARFMDSVREHASASVLQPMLLRSMMQARYDTQNLGHYGLASTAYLHFTSPIRRYPDLLVHRELRRALESGTAKSKTRRKHGDEDAHSAREDELQALAEGSSDAERRATDLERKLDALYMTRWCQQHVGQEFDGVLTGLSEMGLFVSLPTLGAEGFVPSEGLLSLGREKWELHTTGAFIFQARSGRRITLGTGLNVRIMEASLERRQVQLELLSLAEGRGMPQGEPDTVVNTRPPREMSSEPRPDARAARRDGAPRDNGGRGSGRDRGGRDQNRRDRGGRDRGGRDRTGADQGARGRDRGGESPRARGVSPAKGTGSGAPRPMTPAPSVAHPPAPPVAPMARPAVEPAVPALATVPRAAAVAVAAAPPEKAELHADPARAAPPAPQAARPLAGEAGAPTVHVPATPRRPPPTARNETAAERARQLEERSVARRQAKMGKQP